MQKNEFYCIIHNKVISLERGLIMDCTGESTRAKIYNEYDIKAIGCIVLYGGREVKSDAGGKLITDKYYKFLCIHKNDGHHEFIQCGYPTAKLICDAKGIELPSEFNPFKGTGGIGSSKGGKSVSPKNKGRRQLISAIMLFVTSKDDILKPETAIFKVKERIEKNMYSNLELRDVKAVNTILGNFHTNITKIITELGLHGTVRKYNFDILIKMIDDNKITPNNYR